MTVSASTRRTVSTRVLASGDALAFVLFAVIGLINHDEGITVGGLARNALPILAVWFVVAPFVGTYARPGFATMVATWAIAVPCGVAIRAVWLHRSASSKQVAFGIVALLSTLALLSGWRFVASRLRVGGG